MGTKTGKKSLNKGQSIRKKHCASPAGICFEALEPRLLLSGSWGAGVEASPAESQANTLASAARRPLPCTQMPTFLTRSPGSNSGCRSSGVSICWLTHPC